MTICQPIIRYIDLESFDYVRAAQRMADLLNADEQARQARFRFEKDRNTFLVAHVLKRLFLAEQLGADPRSFEFMVGAQGKPQISEAPAWHFNLSHTNGWIVMVVTRDVACGIDVEWPRNLSDIEKLAEHVLAPSELSLFQSLEDKQAQFALFMSYWTAKEAAIKADGRGISMGLKNIAILDAQSPSPEFSSIEAECCYQMSLLRHDLGTECFCASAYCSDSPFSLTVPDIQPAKTLFIT